MKLNLAVAALLSSLIVIPTAQAGGPYGSINVGNWKGGAYANDQSGEFSHCAAGVGYDSGIYVVVRIGIYWVSHTRDVAVPFTYWPAIVGTPHAAINFLYACLAHIANQHFPGDGMNVKAKWVPQTPKPDGVFVRPGAVIEGIICRNRSIRPHPQNLAVVVRETLGNRS